MVTILFLIVHLFPTNDVYQLMKLPIFFEHYAEHKILSPDISFFDFLTLHYINDSPKDFDHKRDMQLPFKTSDHFSTPTNPAFIPDSIIIFHIGSLEITRIKMYVSDDFFNPSDFPSGIWQPPKFC